MGNFNVALGAHECSSTVSSHRLPMEEFQSFIATLDLFDIEYTGNIYTWSTHHSTGSVSTHLNRALAT